MNTTCLNGCVRHDRPLNNRHLAFIRWCSPLCLRILHPQPAQGPHPCPGHLHGIEPDDADLVRRVHHAVVERATPDCCAGRVVPVLLCELGARVVKVSKHIPESRIALNPVVIDDSKRGVPPATTEQKIRDFIRGMRPYNLIKPGWWRVKP